LLAELVLVLIHAASPMQRGAIATRATVSVDGDLSEWRFGVSPLSPVVGVAGSMVEEGEVTSAADASAEVMIAVSDHTLSLAAIVTDDRVIAEHRGGEMWRGDMLEVLFEKDGALVHIGFSPSGDAHVFSKHTLVIKSRTRIEAPGWVLEASITTDAPGKINFAIKDADPGESPAGHMVWSGHRHNERASLGMLAVREALAKQKVNLECTAGDVIALNSPLKARGRALIAGDAPLFLRMLNFQGAKNNWARYLEDWDEAAVMADLDRAAALKANAIRVFLFFESFGANRPKSQMLTRLDAIITGAAARGMLTVVSFFADKKDFRPSRYGEMEAHLSAVVSRYKSDAAIAMWDLMNEPDHGFALPGATFTAPQVYAWSERMLAHVKRQDPTHLVTLGLAGHFASSEKPSSKEETLALGDVMSLHWYFAREGLGKGLDRARAAFTGPIVLQEFGSTAWHETEDEAARYYESVCRQSASLAGVAAWELMDHPTGSIDSQTPRMTQTAENLFGLYDEAGHAKAQAAAFCRCGKPAKLKIGRAR
jgi:Cellulase (glycosyl hydrolase family 5)